MEDSKETRKKEKIRYNVLFVPDKDTETVKHLSINLEVLVALFVVVAFLMIAAITCCFILTGERKKMNNNAQVLEAQMQGLVQQNSELSAQNKELLTENEELQEKVVILSDTINDKIQQEQKREEEIAQTYIPTSFPLKGTASYNEDEAELEGNPIAFFHASPGTSVVSTANGTVSSIAGDVGVGYIIMIDHGNGYYTVYRNGASPKVKKGDTVTNETELFNIEAGHEVLGYQIIENERYIDPLSLMETYG